MAKVTITFEDDFEKGNVDIQLEATPPMPGDAPGAEERTPAQEMALRIMEGIHEASGGEMEVEGEFDDE